jgi:formylglycine-generating enzyme
MRHLLILLIGLSITAVSSAATPGIATEKPADGPSVAIPGGFMVPYEQPLPGSEVTFTMIPVPAGKVTMLVNSEDSTKGSYEVIIEPYWIGKCEVSWAEYWRFMELDKAFARLQILRNARSADAAKIDSALGSMKELSAVISAPPNEVDAVTAPTALYEADATYESGEEPELPAVTMTPYAAKQYTKWLSRITGADFRLPSEAEWQHAAAGGAEPTGDDFADQVWFDENSDYAAQPVGTKAPNSFGLHDMLGNVAEFVLDAAAPEERGKLVGKKLSGLEAVVWPTTRSPRVAKGGYYDVTADQCSIAGRLLSVDEKGTDESWKLEDPNVPVSPWWYTSAPATGVGFRIVRPLEPMSADVRAKAWEEQAPEILKDVAARMREGRGKHDAARPELPAAVKQLESAEVKKLLD